MQDELGQDKTEEDKADAGLAECDPMFLARIEGAKVSLARLGADLIKGQLLLEDLKDQTLSATDLLYPEEVSAKFGEMENDANQVSNALREIQRRTTLARIRKIQEFLAKSKFIPDFSKPYHEAVRLLNGTPPES